MNTKLVMTVSALWLALTGISLSFLPGEIAGYIGISSIQSFELILQIAGALFFAFAMLNWMAKGSHIGGIYNRPIAIANFTHFLVGGLALIKFLGKHPESSYPLWLVAGSYVIFAVLFGLILFRSPVLVNQYATTNQMQK